MILAALPCLFPFTVFAVLALFLFPMLALLLVALLDHTLLTLLDLSWFASLDLASLALLALSLTALLTPLFLEDSRRGRSRRRVGQDPCPRSGKEDHAKHQPAGQRFGMEFSHHLNLLRNSCEFTSRIV
jgi:hypothetical protein